MSAQYIFTMHRLSKVHPARQDGARQPHARVLPWREDRRARLQRRGQVDTAADHGGPGRGVPGRGGAGAGRERGHARPGAPAGREQGRARQRREGVAETQALLDRFNELAANYSDETAEEFGEIQARIDAADAWNLDTRSSSTRWTRCACPRRTRTWARSPAASAGAWRCAGCCCARPTCCCWTSPPTTSTPSRSRGWSSTWPSTGARSWRSPTTATSWTTSRAGSSSSTAAGGFRTRATTPAGWSRSRRGWRKKSARRRAVSARSPRSSSGSGPTRRANARSPRRGWRATRR